MFKKFAALAAAAALSLGVMTGCGASGTTADSTGYSAENPLVLTLAHGLSETHTVHIAMTQFADEVAEKTDGRIQVKIFPNGQLGSENENLEQLQAGVIAMTKVSAPGLATYNDAFNTFGLPYIFNDTDDFYHVMDSQEMQDFFLSTGDDGFVTLTYYTSGARSFYTKDRAIRTPADLKGLKIRVQDMKSQTDMMSYLGGIPVAMSYGDVYTSLQTGIIDGTENNETALTTGKHGEVCKVYSVDQHAMIPDVLIMSEKVWETISPEDQEIILEAAHDSTDAHKVMWDTAVEEAVKEAQETMGVEFVYDVDKEAFREATQPMIEAYEEQYPGVKTLLDTIDAARGGIQCGLPAGQFLGHGVQRTALAAGRSCPMGGQIGPAGLGLGVLGRFIGGVPLGQLAASGVEMPLPDGVFSGVAGLLSELNGKRYAGYEIHMGRSEEARGALFSMGNVYGSYVHGIFDEQEVAGTILKALCTKKGVSFESLGTFDARAYKERQYDLLADAVRAGLNMEFVYRVVRKEI